MQDKARRKIWFMREDERKAEDIRMRAAKHVKVCNDFADELAQLLYIQTPEVAVAIIKHINKEINEILSWIPE